MDQTRWRSVKTCLDDPLSANRTRVAYLAHSFRAGGIERCIVNLVNNLDRERFDPLIICLTESGDSANCVVDTPIFEIGKKRGWDNKAIGELARVLKSQKVSVLHSHNWGTLIEGSLARGRAGVPVHLHTEHGQGLHENIRGPKRLLRKWASAWAFRRLSTLSACAKCVAPLIEARSGFPANQILYLPNGVPNPLGRFDGVDRSHFRATLGISDRAVVIGSTGRLVPVKGFELAIEATAKLACHAREIHLVLVGDGESRPDLKDLAESLGIGNRVHFVGYQNDVGPWLKMFDLFLNTSKSEAMSLSVLEAMAVGLPIVAGDVGDNRDMVLGHEMCGRILESRDVSSLAESIIAVVSDSALAKQYGENARRVYEQHFSIRAMVNLHDEVYHCLLAGQPFPINITARVDRMRRVRRLNSWWKCQV